MPTKRTLIRRVTLDLTGLLPTPEEVDAFLADSAPDAYEKVVDRLLASPTYGERWARHWLDVVGYADSNGFAEADSLRPHAWRYRDYVIRALNADKPWNDFIQEQLAGDELAGVTHGDATKAVHDPQQRDELIATAFLRLGPDGTGDTAPDAKLARNQAIAEEMKDRLLVAARPHGGLRAVPRSSLRSDLAGRLLPLPRDLRAGLRLAKVAPADERLYSLYTPEERAKADEIEKQAQAIEARGAGDEQKVPRRDLRKGNRETAGGRAGALSRRARHGRQGSHAGAEGADQEIPLGARPLLARSLRPGVQKKVTEKNAEATKLRGTKPAEGMIMALTEVKGAVPETHAFQSRRSRSAESSGDAGRTDRPASRSSRSRSSRLPAGSTGRRLAYARWLTSGKHPLVARVLVNRFWLNHFGRGIVSTAGDFGFLGERPDASGTARLAGERVYGGRLEAEAAAPADGPEHHLSAVFAERRRRLQADPDNRLYGRFKIQRLDAEALARLAARRRRHA